MKITVGRSHIESARRKDSHHCMIADAIKEQLNVQFILVDTQSIRFSDPKYNKRYVFLTPPRAQNEILRWDRGIDVQPFVFDLEAPVKVTDVRKRWTGNPKALKKARKRYETKRRDPMAPRLVKKRAKPQTKVTRHRQFGIRRWTRTA